MKKVINSHCHLNNIENINEFLDNNHDIFVCNAVNEEELIRYLPIEKENFWLTTGQHPLYPPNTITDERLTQLLDKNQLYAVGEVGFDKRNPDFHWQKDVFLRQVNIAKQYHKYIIIHCVGYYYELLNIIKQNFPIQPFILHNFQGSIEIVREFSKYNVTFSLHKNIIKIKNAQQVINEIIQNHKYCFETDVCENNLHDVRVTERMIRQQA